MSISVNAKGYPDKADIVDDHFHNYEEVYGLAAVPSATHFGDRETLTPYLVTSGNNLFGAATGLLGTADTPFRTGKKLFDCRRISVQDVSNANPFILRMIWGTAAQTPAQAVAALQYSDTVIQQLTAAGNNKPQDIWNVRVLVGNQLWAEIKSATNLATVHIYILVHEYPSDSPSGD